MSNARRLRRTVVRRESMKAGGTVVRRESMKAGGTVERLHPMQDEIELLNVRTAALNQQLMTMARDLVAAFNKAIEERDKIIGTIATGHNTLVQAVGVVIKTLERRGIRPDPQDVAEGAAVQQARPSGIIVPAGGNWQDVPIQKSGAGSVAAEGPVTVSTPPSAPPSPDAQLDLFEEENMPWSKSSSSPSPPATPASYRSITSSGSP